MRTRYVGKVTHVYKSIGCVAVRLQDGEDFTIMTGEHILFEKGDPDKPDVTGMHRSDHFIKNIQIDHQNLRSAHSGEHCAFALSGNKLPPNNANVFLVLAS